MHEIYVQDEMICETIGFPLERSHVQLFVCNFYISFIYGFIISIRGGEEENRKWVAVEHDAFVLYHR